MLRWNVEVIGIADIAGQVGKGKFLRFDEMMEIRRAVVPHSLQIVRFEDAQHLQGGHSLTVRREFPECAVAEPGPDRIHPLHRMVSQILQGDKAPVRLHEFDKPCSQFPAVHDLRPFCGQQSEGGGQIGIAEYLTLLRRPFTIDQPGVPGALITQELPGLVRPLPGDDGGDGIALLGEPDHRLERLSSSVPRIDHSRSVPSVALPRPTSRSRTRLHRFRSCGVQPGRVPRPRSPRRRRRYPRSAVPRGPRRSRTIEQQ